MALLNEKLPSVIEKNMVPPSLQYRTGRFADSVKVTNVSSTDKGYPRIEYDYMQYPYAIFEARGSYPWNTPPDRHPRNIINKSIREIAAGIIRERFYIAERKT